MARRTIYEDEMISVLQFGKVTNIHNIEKFSFARVPASSFKVIQSTNQKLSEFFLSNSDFSRALVPISSIPAFLARLAIFL